MSERAAIPVDAVVAKALERRTVHPVGSLVYVRNSLNGTIELNEVLAVAMVASNYIGFHVHYVVAAPWGLPTTGAPRVIARRVVSAQYVFDTPAACTAQTAPPPPDDSLDDNVYAVVQAHRRKFAEQRQRRSK